MNSTETIIKELEDAITEATYPDRPRKFMMSLELAEKVLVLLKGQQPRVMTESEIRGIELPTPVWIEEPFEGCDYGYWVLIRYNRILYPERGEQCYFDDGALTGMGEKWRPWTSRPTDEQRRSEKWANDKEQVSL